MGGQRANPEPLDFSPQPEMARVKYLKERKHRATSGYITDPSKQIWKTFSTLDNLPILQLAEAAAILREMNVKVAVIKPNRTEPQGSAARSTAPSFQQHLEQEYN